MSDKENDNDNNSNASSDINDFWGDLPEGIFDDQTNQDSDDEGVDISIPGAEHLLVLLDCSPDMFVPCMRENDDDDERMIGPMDAVIKALQTYVRQSVRTTVMSKQGKRNGFGVYLFATRERQRLDLDEEIEKKQKAKYSKNEINRDDSDEEKQANSEDSEQDSDDDDQEPKSSFSSNITDLHTLIPLGVPGINTITKLRHCLEHPKNRKTGRIFDLEQEFGHKERHATAKAAFPSALKKALREIANIFREAKCVKKAGAKQSKELIGDDIKTVWIFTSNDDPAPTEQDQHHLKGMVQDLKGNGVVINVWPLPTKHRKGGFPSDSFFHQIIDMAPSGDDQDLNLDDLMAQRWKNVRRAFEVPLFFPDQLPKGSSVQHQDLGDSQPQIENGSQDDEHFQPKEKLPLGIMLNFFVPLAVQRKPNPKKILRKVGVNDENVELERISYMQGTESTEQFGRFVASANAEEKTIEKQQPGLAKIGRFVELKSLGEYIPLTLEDVASLKKDANLCGDFASLALLGFKPRNQIPFHFKINKTYFVYPEDKVVEGSRAAFAHLHQSMMKKNVVGIGELLVRRTAVSKLVSIYPIDEEHIDDDEEALRVCPPGWIVCVAPFQDEFNELVPDLSVQEGFDVDTKVLDATKPIISHMFMENFDSGARSFDNPYLKKYWDYVEHKALDEDMPNDKTNDYILGHRGTRHDEYVEELRVLAERLEAALPEVEVVTKKRAAGGAAKNTKLKANENTDWAMELRKGNLDKYTNADLKDALRSYDKKTSGSKAQMIERLTDAINEHDP